MFDENIIVRANNSGAKSAAAPSVHQIAICCFGQSQTLSLVTVSRTLNKLLVRDLSQAIRLVRVQNRITFERVRSEIDRLGNEQLEREQQISYIATKDVINSLTAKEFRLHSTAGQAVPQVTRDLLLIGCSNSIVIYDTYEQTNLFNINTSTKITVLLSPTKGAAPDQQQDELTPLWSNIFGGGVQKLYSLLVDRLNPLLPTSNLDKLISIDVTSERSTSDTISCLCHGRFGDHHLLLTGSVERKIRIYLFDTLDKNIQACKLTVNESSKVTCLCPVTTVQPKDEHDYSARKQSGGFRPSLVSFSGKQQSPTSGDGRIEGEQMNYFAFGLENGFIGVYRLIASGGGQQQISLFAERLWRHKSSQVPISVVLFDLNGDGLDELVFGYANSRLEARAPFTGQLLAKTRCFKSDELVALTLLEAASFCDRIPPATTGSEPHHQSEVQKSQADGPHHQVLLLACSASTSYVAYCLQRCRPHKPLTDYLGGQLTDLKILEHGERTINEADESEDWASSLVNLASIGAQEGNDELEVEPSSTLTGLDAFGHDLSKVQDEADLQAIETPGDNLVPVPSECRQNNELLQRISAQHHDHAQIKLKVSQIYFEKMQQLSHCELDSMAGGVCSAYRWDYDEARAGLRLSVVFSDQAGFVELVELVDKSGILVPSGHLILSPGSGERSLDSRLEAYVRRGSPGAESDTNLLILPVEPVDQETEIKLNFRFYCQQLGAKRSRLNQTKDSQRRQQLSMSEQEPFVSRVYERTIPMPRFSMFVPPSGHSFGGFESVANRSMTMAFKLDDGTSHLQVLDWMRDNFICFQFGQFFGDAYGSSLPAYQPANDMSALQKRQIDEQMGAPISKLLETADLSDAKPFDIPENWSTGRRGENGEMELDLKLMDLRKVAAGEDAGWLHITFTLGRVLTIECDDVDVMVAIIDSLLIDCLRLKAPENSMVRRKGDSPKFDAMIAKLDSIGEQTNQLEESERRIQTELYELAEMTNNLMQQLAIANQLNEFNISKELLTEISMMLDGAQNSAQAYQLNNQQRLKMSREANNLREKMSFLVECSQIN